MTTDKDRAPPSIEERARALMDQFAADEPARAERQKQLARIVPEANLPQKFLNKLMVAAAVDGSYHMVATL